jgi:hypothetical protein
VQNRYRRRSGERPIVVIGAGSSQSKETPMKYMMLIAGDEERWFEASEDAGEIYRRIEAWWEAESSAGRIVEGHQLEPSSTATTVRIDGTGNATVTDGPFVEGKEMVGGYGILEVADLDEALAVASSWPAPDTIEIRPVIQRHGDG